MQFEGKINGMTLAEKGKDEDAQTVIELKISAQLTPQMDVNEFVNLFKKPVTINLGLLQEELKLAEEQTEKETKKV